MDLGLAGKTVLVCGASIGVGRACAELFAAEGARVFAVARGAAAIEAVAAAIRADGGDATGLAADFSSAADVDRVVDTVYAAAGAIDVLVNVVYTAEYRDSTLAGDDAHWDRHYQAVLMSHVRPVRRIVPRMVAGGGGSVVNIVSTSSGRNFLIPVATYSAFKAALAHWTRNVAKEFIREGVRVNAVMPGIVFGERRTDLLADLARRGVAAEAYFRDANRTGFMPPDDRLRNQPTTYGPRWGVPADIANVVAFLASRRARRITGSWWNVDGGSDY